MPLASRGRKRDQVRAVPVSATLKYGFKTIDLSAVPGVSAGDVTALGQIEVTGDVGLIVFSPSSPKPAQFRKKLTGVAQGSVSAYGNGVTAGAVNTAAGAGWQMTKGIRRTSFGDTSKSKAIAVRTESGLLVKRYVPISEAGNAGLLGWETAISASDLDKLVYAPGNGKVAMATQLGGTSKATFPVSFNKQTDIASTAGWKLIRQESGFVAVAAD